MDEKELNKNKNIYPWILNGLSLALSIFAYIVFVFQIIPSDLFWAFSKSWFYAMAFYFLLVLVLGVVGLVMGIKRLKTRSRMSAVLTIIVSIIAILLAIFSGIMVDLSIFARTT